MAAVLRGSAPASGNRVPAEAFEATRRARALLSRAEEDARAVLARAEQEREAVRAAAEEAGLRQARARAGALLAGAARERDRILAACEREVVALAIDVARKVIGRELRADPAAVAALAGPVLEAARGRRQVTLRIHPADAASIRAASSGLAPALAGVPPTSIEEDASLAPGDVVVETEADRLDARIETRIETLREALEEALG